MRTPTLDGAPSQVEERWMVGDSYPDTAGEPLEQIAARLRQDLLDVQGDGMIPTGIRFGVVADESGPVGVLRVSISGLPRTADPDHAPTRRVVRAVFELASHYNRVGLAHPERARFLQHIVTLTDQGRPGATWVATMLGEPDPLHRPSPGSSLSTTADQPASAS